uniref:Uncharacterized protein n=1 Tax=Anguilla anguilla TaxID=7936 RepID=A0A0E9WD08_ANGAN
MQVLIFTKTHNYRPTTSCPYSFPVIFLKYNSTICSHLHCQSVFQKRLFFG